MTITNFYFRNLRPHPNVVLLLGVCQNPVCIVTEFLPRGSLWDILNSTQPINTSLKKKIIRDVASGLYHLHNEVGKLLKNFQ